MSSCPFVAALRVRELFYEMTEQLSIRFLDSSLAFTHRVYFYGA